jgi:ABC-type transport system involved in multi-copper enzyme maturation permease subunit
MNERWKDQVLAIIRLEMKKTFLAKRGIWVYLLAAAPVVLFWGHAVRATLRHQPANFAEDSIVFAGIFQFFYLRLVVFFGCLGIFMNLFRGEFLDRTLHFYLLAPVRREVLVVGKYCAGLLAACVIFTVSTALQLIALGWHVNSNDLSRYLTHEHGFVHIFAYLGVTLLACIGYGSVFLAAGLLFRNPIIPAAGILLWEAINPFVPTLLRKISIIYYLKSLCPVSIPLDPGTPALLAMFVTNAEPVAAPLATLGLLAVAAFVLAAAAVSARKLQINYTTE